MPRPYTKDPTAFFSVVGVPYISEHHAMDFPVRERRTDDQRPRRLEIGFATICVGLCTLMLGVSLFAGDGAIRLAEVALTR